MTNGRGKKRDTGRDPGGFVAMPWSVLDSAAYMGLSPTAKALLMEVARQYHRDDNGRAVLTRDYLATRGWFSAGAIQQAKAELIAAGLIFETVKGCRPNKASWYGCTWRVLDKIEGYDMDAERGFERGAYRKTPPKEKRPPPACAKPKKNASLIPAHGTESAAIVPAHGTESAATVPAHGTIRPTFDPLSVPAHGIPLEVPSEGARIGGVPLVVDLGVDRSSLASKRGTTAAAAARKAGEKSATCQHPCCQTLTLGRNFCAKHRPPGNATTDRQSDATVH